MASVVQKYMKAFRLYGWKDTLAKMYSVRVCVCVWLGGRAHHRSRLIGHLETHYPPRCWHGLTCSSTLPFQAQTPSSCSPPYPSTRQLSTLTPHT
jgi:hypothetical protein